MGLFFTSDWHIGHKNILTFCERPFKDVEEMQECFIDNYNSVVTNKDEVWFLGDLVLKATNEQIKSYKLLNGKKHVIWGNHDKKYRRLLEPYFESAQDYKELKYEKTRLILMHFPIYSWNGMRRGSIHLHGHSHGTLNDLNREMLETGLKRLDVGVDVHNYYPIEFSEVLNKITYDANSKKNQ